MKQFFYYFIVAVMVQFRASYPADETTSNTTSMSEFANKTESAMESMMSSTNTTQTFTSSKSNLILEAAKKLDITNITSDEEFLRLLFEGVFSIIKDTKAEGALFLSDLATIVPTIIEKFIKQFQAALFNVFFGGFVNAAATAADVGLKIATALETGKLSVASQGIETAQNIADTIASNVPSNGITDGVKNIVNASLAGADGAIKAAKTIQTDASNALSDVLNKFKMVNASTSPVDIGLKVANDVESAKLNAASQGVESAQKIADKITGSLPSNGVTEEVKKIVDTSLDGGRGAVNAAKSLQTQGSNAIGSVLNTFKIGK